MVEDFFNKGEDEIRKSKFNEAALKMKRIHDLQEQINLSDFNLLAFDNEKGQYNFDIKFAAINSLFIEVSSKAGEDSIKEGKRYRKYINLLLEHKPPYIQIRDERSNPKIKIKLNNNNFKLLKEWLFNYNLFARKLIDKHGFAVDDAETEGGFD